MPHAMTDRPTYHHGDLRNALISAGEQLAERGGPAAVGVRAAAREVGVTPTAAYRHFAKAEDLIQAVKERALESLMQGLSARPEIELTGSPQDIAVARLAGLGRAYIRVALASPGAYRLAFGTGGSVMGPGEVPATFALLTRCMDELVATGYLAAQRRPLAEIAAWSAVHGLACLAIDGHLTALPDGGLDLAIDRVIEMATRGFAGDPDDEQDVP